MRLLEGSVKIFKNIWRHLVWVFSSDEDQLQLVTVRPRRGVGFFSGLLSSEMLACEPKNSQEDSKSFLSWLFSPEKLENSNSTARDKQEATSFLGSLLASEELEKICVAREASKIGFLRWLFKKECL